MKDLKLVYKADTEQLALEALDMLEENWGGKYPSSITSWRNNWPQLSTYFKYPGEIRKLIYTTNSIENFNRQLRKVTKSKTMSFVFPCAANYNFLTGISCNVDCRKNSIEEFAEKTPGIYSCQCSFHGIDVGFTWIE